MSLFFCHSLWRLVDLLVIQCRLPASDFAAVVKWNCGDPLSGTHQNKILGMQRQKREFRVGRGHEHGRREWLQSIPYSFSRLQAQTFETDRALVQDMKFG
jgi:hypothetical protein